MWRQRSKFKKTQEASPNNSNHGNQRGMKISHLFSMHYFLNFQNTFIYQLTWFKFCISSINFLIIFVLQVAAEVMAIVAGEEDEEVTSEVTRVTTEVTRVITEVTEVTPEVTKAPTGTGTIPSRMKNRTSLKSSWT